MPEGHTLHRLARSHRERFAGRVVRVSSPQGRFAAGAALVDGRLLDDVTAYGKHLFAWFGDRVVHGHLGLYGKFTSGVGAAPPPRGALRMRWETDDAWTDLRGATACEVLSPDEVELIIARLGPDPLVARPDGGPAFDRLHRSRVAVGALLMDQRVIAGIGNVYRAEVLYRQLLSPFRQGRDVTAAEWEPLWTDVVTAMRAGLRSGRIVTTRPEDRPRRSGRVRQEDAHYVYRREGLPCRRCGTPVSRQVMATRNLFWCRTCQAR